jgi:CBS domain containing-hemolysin-like protein
MGLLLAALFIALNGFFVAAEFALVKMSTMLPGRPADDPRTNALRQVVSRLERYLSVTQLGITLASLGLGWIGEPTLERYVLALARWAGGGEPGRVLHAASTVVAFTLLTFAHVLFGELVPKLVAIQRSERVAFSSSAPLHLIYLVFRPLLWVLERATKVILRAMGMSSDAASEGTLSEEEILGILAANMARSPGGKARSELLERVVRSAQRTARHAMVPRVDVFMLPLETSGERAIRELRTTQYSRVVLTKEADMDEVAGYLYAKDFLLDPAASKLEDLRSVRRDILFVPETQGLLDVMGEMQRAQIPIAVVVDEYGGTSGIVTMEDLLEEIVGEIRDEFDVEPARVVQVVGEAQTWDADARASMEELRAIGVKGLPEEAAETIGAVVAERLGRIPRVGDKVELGAGAIAVITSVSRRRVVRVRVRVRASEPPPAEAEA